VQPDKPNQTPLSFFFIHRAVTCSHPNIVIMGWRRGGFGVRAGAEPLGICVAGYPDIHLYVPALRGATLGRCRGLPGQGVHRPRDTRAIPHRGLGSGPDRAEARRSRKPPYIARLGMYGDCLGGLWERGCLRSSLCFDDGRRQFTNVFRLLQQPQPF
jgi:hypothetical protein